MYSEVLDTGVGCVGDFALLCTVMCWTLVLVAFVITKLGQTTSNVNQ